MALYKYTKAPIKVRIPDGAPEIEPEPEIEEQKIDNDDSGFSRLFLRNAKYIFPVITGLLGITLLLAEAVPFASQALAEKLSPKYDNEIVALADPKVLGVENVLISNPDSDYFQNLVTEIKKNSSSLDKPDESFKEKFYLTIPAINAENIPVASNVESFDPSVYKPVLESALAHFKGTPLPFQNGNTVIYGHSAAGILGGYRGTQYIFSKLQDLNIGDEVDIKIEGENIKYQVTQTKIIEPENMSVLESRQGSKSITLVTCYPNGHNAKRLVVTAEER